MGAGSLGSSIVIADAEGTVTAHDRTLLVQYSGHINLTHDWAMSLLSRMGFVKRKATTKATAQITQEQFQQMKCTYLQQVVSMVRCHKIPASLHCPKWGVDIEKRRKQEGQSCWLGR